MRDRLGGAPEVVAVEVGALPAVQLLWRHADRLQARVRRYDARGVDVGAELARTAAIDVVDLRIAAADSGRGVVVRDLVVRKRGELLQLSGRIGDRRLAAALPGAADVVELIVRGLLSSDRRVAIERVAVRPLGGGQVLISVLGRVR